MIWAVGADEDLQAGPAARDDACRFAPRLFRTGTLIADWLPSITAMLGAVDGEQQRHRVDALVALDRR